MKRTIRSAISVSALLLPLVAWAQPTDGRKDANESTQEPSGQAKGDSRESNPKKLGSADFPSDIRAALVEFHKERQGRSSRSAVTTSRPCTIARNPRRWRSEQALCCHPPIATAAAVEIEAP